MFTAAATLFASMSVFSVQFLPAVYKEYNPISLCFIIMIGGIQMVLSSYFIAYIAHKSRIKKEEMTFGLVFRNFHLLLGIAADAGLIFICLGSCLEYYYKSLIWLMRLLGLSKAWYNVISMIMIVLLTFLCFFRTSFIYTVIPYLGVLSAICMATVTLYYNMILSDEKHGIEIKKEFETADLVIGYILYVTLIPCTQNIINVYKRMNPISITNLLKITSLAAIGGGLFYYIIAYFNCRISKFLDTEAFLNEFLLEKGKLLEGIGNEPEGIFLILPKLMIMSVTTLFCCAFIIQVLPVKVALMSLIMKYKKEVSRKKLDIFITFSIYAIIWGLSLFYEKILNFELYNIYLIVIVIISKTIPSISFLLISREHHNLLKASAVLLFILSIGEISAIAVFIILTRINKDQLM